MTLTLLFDLDDTLIGNDINVFLPAYIRLLGKHLAGFVAPERMAKGLLAASQGMLDNNCAATNLESAFDAIFYPAIGMDKADLATELETFYLHPFNELQPLTTLRPEALKLIEGALQQNHTVVVATNPVFPQEAIYQRLRWAGLAPEKIPFHLISNFHDFHFAKPNPAFLTEALAQLGWPNQPAVMVGNSLEEDILPAIQLGLPVFWVNPARTPLPEKAHPLSAVGELSEVLAWITHLEANHLRQNLSQPGFLQQPGALLAGLKAAPAAFDTLSRSLQAEQWRQRPAPGEWSLTEISCHLRDVDREVNFPRLDMIIQQENPFIPGVVTDPWAEERDYQSQDGPVALQEFVKIRCQMIRCLENLSPADWERRVRHAIFGPTSLRELVSFTVTHDQNHIQQVHATLHPND